MALHPLSFLLGVGAALALPAVSRVFRPAAVQLTAAGMALFDEVRRVTAEQMEALEDIVAEAQSQREESPVAAGGVSVNGDEGEPQRPARRARKQRSA